MSLLKGEIWTSLVAQWLRNCLPMQETQVQPLLWEDFTCRGANKPREPQLSSPCVLEPMLCNEEPLQ